MKYKQYSTVHIFVHSGNEIPAEAMAAFKSDVPMSEIMETLRMVQTEKLDIRTITLGLSLRDCADHDGAASRKRIYDKITRCAEQLVPVAETIEADFGIPIINRRISVTPISRARAARVLFCRPSSARMLAAILGVGVVLMGREATHGARASTNLGVRSACRVATHA